MMKRTLSLLSVAGLVAACATPQAGGPDAHHAHGQPPKPAAQAVHYPPVPLTGEMMYEILLADIAGQRGHLDVASQSLARAAEQARDPRLIERAAHVALYAKDYTRALAATRLWIELQPESIEAHQANGEALLGLDLPAEAVAAFSRAIAFANGGPQVYSKVATALARHPNRQLALGAMQSLVKEQPLHREAQFALAHLSVRMGDLDLALQSIDRALAISPGWEEAAIFKARVLVSRKDAQATAHFFQDFLKTYPKATSLRLNYARYLIDAKEWEQARAQFKRVAAEMPQDADSLYAVGLLALQVNQLAEARNYLRRHLELQDNDQARLYLGQIAEQMRNYDEAEQWYEAIGDEEQAFEAQARLAILVAKRGDVEGARARLHALQPTSDQQRAQLALSEDQILRDARRYDEALKVLGAALETLPDDADLLYARALVAEKLDMLDLHEADLRRILAKDANNAHALNALGYTLADRTDRFQESLALLERAIALKPDDPFIIDSMGWVQYRLGNTAEAIKLLRRALTIRADAEISAHLGEVLWVSGDRAAAESVWGQALKDTPDNEVLLGIIKKFKQ